MTPEVIALQAEVEAVERRLNDLKTRVHEARMRAAGIVTGQVVTYRGNPYLVHDVQFFTVQGLKPWVKGLPRLKDGNWGKHPKPLYGDWELADGSASR